MTSQIASGVQDAQSKKRLVTSEIRYRRLFEAARDGILIIDTTTRKIVDANPFMSELMGFTKDELLGKELWEIGLLKDAEASQSVFLELEKNSYVRYEHLPLQTKAGKHWDVECVCNVYQEDHKPVIQCNIRDITRRREIEAELERVMIQEKASRLDAENAIRARDQFLAIVSHELRTPLNAIIGWTHLLRIGGLDDTTEERALEVIERNGKMQARLIEDLLDSSRVISGQLDIKPGPVKLELIIKLAVDSIRPSATAKAIRIQTELDAVVGTVSVDINRLQQVLSNLLSNAIKFTPTGGQIDISLVCTETYARITVSDTGIGFKAEFLPNAFDIFRQQDGSATRQKGGLGLGLTIARKIVEMHGGTLNAENRADQQGASLILDLPLVDSTCEPFLIPAPVPVHQGTPAETLPGISGLRILIVDDELTSLEMLNTLLRHWGADVRTCDSALEAFELFQQWKPDMLLSDIAMPEKDGNWLIRKIREFEKTHGGQIPAIAETAYLGLDEREAIRGAGYNQIISKPIEPFKLMLAMSNLVTAML